MYAFQKRQGFAGIKIKGRNTRIKLPASAGKTSPAAIVLEQGTNLSPTRCEDGT